MGEGFHFVRHGETSDNLAGVRCGGERDVPLTDRGHIEAETTAVRFAEAGWPCRLVIAGPLRRTTATAAPFAVTLRVPVVTRAWLRERALGDWNGLPIADTRSWIAEGRTPPGGEAEEVFATRVLAGVAELGRVLDEWPLLVGSKGIGRVLLHRLAGRPGIELHNCAIVRFSRTGPQRWTAENL